MTDNNVNFVERFDAFSGFAGGNLPQFLSSCELRNFQIKLIIFSLSSFSCCGLVCAYTLIQGLFLVSCMSRKLRITSAKVFALDQTEKENSVTEFYKTCRGNGKLIALYETIMKSLLLTNSA